MNEHELSSRLHAVASSVAARPDIAEIELGAGHARSRRRLATGVIAGMLIAGAGGAGFGLGRSVDNEGEIAGSAAQESIATDPTTTSTGTASTTIAQSPLDTVVNVDVPVTTTAESVDMTDDQIAAIDAAATPGYYGGPYGGSGPMELAYERELDNGLRLRVLRGQSWNNMQGWPEGQWRPAAFCFGTAEMRITIDGKVDSADVVDVTGGQFYDEMFGEVEIQTVETGRADDHPMRILTVQAIPGIAEVSVVWADGLADTTTVIDGLAVLVVDGSGAWETEYTLDVSDVSGTHSVDASPDDRYNDPEWRLACQEPPPELPAAGEQPADVAAATAEIEANFALLWDRDVAQDDKRDVLDDWTGVSDAVDAVYAGGYAVTAETASHHIDELVFVSPTEAWFRYSIVTDVSSFYDRYGTATLTDVGWQLPRALICQDLGLAGANCEPFADAIYPPSWYDRYGPRECVVLEDGTETCVAEEYAGD
jgi:hypothetical protein